MAGLNTPISVLAGGKNTSELEKEQESVADPIHAKYRQLLKAERAKPVAVHYQESRKVLRQRAREIVRKKTRI